MCLNVHVYVFSVQTSRLDLPYCAENVCMELDEDSSHLYAAGSRSHVTFIDGRLTNKAAGSVRSPDKDSGELPRIASALAVVSYQE